MSKYILRFRKINKHTYTDTKEGRKTVETRAATEKYRKIKKGDSLIFVCGKDKFEKKVRKVKIFKSIAALVKNYPINLIMPETTSVKDLREAYYGYQNYREKIKKYGLIAFEL